MGGGCRTEVRSRLDRLQNRSAIVGAVVGDIQQPCKSLICCGIHLDVASQPRFRLSSRWCEKVIAFIDATVLNGSDTRPLSKIDLQRLHGYAVWLCLGTLRPIASLLDLFVPLPQTIAVTRFRSLLVMNAWRIIRSHRASPPATASFVPAFALCSPTWCEKPASALWSITSRSTRRALYSGCASSLRSLADRPFYWFPRRMVIATLECHM